jgi:hypothetical protein
MWEYVYYNLVRYVPTEVSRGELEPLSQKIIIGINAVTTGLILKFRGTGILPQECHTRLHVICCTREGEAYGYLGSFLPFSQNFNDHYSATGVGE